MRRALNLRNLCEKLLIHINEDEVIVGSQVTSYRASSLNPEFGGITPGGVQRHIRPCHSREILRNAQKEPENHKNLLVRVAGFSAYLVELHSGSQEDLIRRTELSK